MQILHDITNVIVAFASWWWAQAGSGFIDSSYGYYQISSAYYVWAAVTTVMGVCLLSTVVLIAKLREI